MSSKDFKTLCLDLGLDNACLYANSLDIKWLQALYHKDNIKQKISEIDLKSFFEKVTAYTFEVAFELDALMTTINSMWDILGQLINECFIDPPIPIDKFYFDKFVNNEAIPNEIKVILNDIKGNEFYQKIKAYANISKHRYTVPGRISLDLSEYPHTASYISSEFEYKEKWHKLTTDTAFKSLKFVGDKLDLIEAKIYEKLKSRKVINSIKPKTGGA